MYWHGILKGALATAVIGLLAAGPQAVAEVSPPLDPDLPLLGRSDFEFDNNRYRYDFGERHLTFGVDVGAGFPSGNTINAFPHGGIVTPYFRGAFGDGNALELDVSIGALMPSGSEAEWLFFRTPLEEGATTSGYLGFLAPILIFRYDAELTSSISRRSKVLFWAGVGMGPAFTKGRVDLTGNGTQPDKTVTNFEVYFDIVPTTGFKFRLTEFAFIQLGLRYHLMWVIGAKINDESSMTYGRPEVIPEFWIGNSRVLDLGIGFGYDFG